MLLAVKLETLGQLAQHYNHDISAAYETSIPNSTDYCSLRYRSIKILRERVLQGGAAWDLMLRDISGVDTVRRNKALTSLCFVLPSGKTRYALRKPHVMAIRSGCSDSD